MNYSLIETIRNRIAHKLALGVIVLSSIITLMATALQLYLDYKHEIAGIDDYFFAVTATQLKNLSRNVWIMDDRQILTQLEGIIQGRDITYAAVTVDDIPRWHSGAIGTGEIRGWSSQLLYLYRDTSVNIGTLEIVANLNGVHQRLFQRATNILITSGLKTFLFAGLILLLFRYSVTRHLEKVASHVVHINFRNKMPPLQLERASNGVDDEFSQVVNVLNIMQRRGYHTFKALKKNEQRLWLFLDSTEEGIFGINKEKRITFANAACLKKLSVSSRQGIIGRKVDEILWCSGSDDMVEKSDEIFIKAMEFGQTVAVDDSFITVHNGSGFYASIRSYPVLAEGNCTGAIIFFKDITEQREVLKEKNLLRQAVRQSPVLILIADAAANIEYVNPGFEKITGYSLTEVVGKKPYFLGGFQENKTAYRHLKETLRRGEKWQGSYRLKAKNGSGYLFDALVSPVFNNDGKVINLIAVCLDITQKIALQNQLNHVQKMEAMGRLSASFAHEFGNPLLGVRSVIKDISERIVMAEEDRLLLDLAYAECDRMKILIRDFQQFHCHRPNRKEIHNIHLILDRVLYLFKKQLEINNLELRKRYESELPLLYVSKDQIAQVFLNLIINSIDAMADRGGVLTITTSTDDHQVFVSVTDTGVGIKDKDLHLIFEPFFTTKPEVEGTGLGLSISYNIIRNHGGDIVVSSKANQGTTFTVVLPLFPLD